MLRLTAQTTDRGFSLIELLVTMAVGLILVAGVLGIFTSTIENQSKSLKMTRLNQEMRSVMDLMVRDLRRSGYWANAVNAVQPSGDLVPGATSGSSVTFTATDTAFEDFSGSASGLEIMTEDGKARITQWVSDTSVTADITRNFSSVAPIEEGEWMLRNPFTDSNFDTELTISSNDECILYAYDRNSNDTVDTNEGFGFRLNGTAIDMRSVLTEDCSATNGWTQATTDRVSVTRLTFDDSTSTCVNTTTGATSSDCSAAATGDVLRFIRNITITMEAELNGDPTVSRIMEEQVRLRNDRMEIQ